MSVANVKPLVTDAGTVYNNVIHISNSRILSHNKGDNYEILNLDTISAIQLLFLIEYNSLNSQDCIGNGICDYPSGSIDESLALFTNSSDAVLYRSIENLWGNCWSIIDHVFISKDDIYYSDKDLPSDNMSPYKKLSFKIINNSGYITRIGFDKEIDFCFLPTKLDGASNILFGDQCYHSPASITIKMLNQGGRWSNSTGCGIYACSYDLKQDEPKRMHNPRLQYYK
jgi:hypothetical protein